MVRRIIIVFGKENCHYTTAAVKALAEAGWPFIYRGYKESQNKTEYWNVLKQLNSSKTNFTFPTIVLFEEDQTHSFKMQMMDSEQLIEYIDSTKHDDKMKKELKTSIKKAFSGFSPMEELLISDLNNIHSHDGSEYIIIS